MTAGNRHSETQRYDADARTAARRSVLDAARLAGFNEQQLQNFVAWVARGFARELGQVNTSRYVGQMFSVKRPSMDARESPE